MSNKKNNTVFSLEIKNLKIKTIIGILPFERKNKQTIFVSLSAKYEFNHDSKDFISYVDVSDDISKIIKKQKFELLEECLIFLKQYLLNKYNFKKSSLKLKIKKPQAVKNALACVSI